MGGRSNEGTGGGPRAARDKEQAEVIIMGFSFSVFEIIRFIFSLLFLVFVFVLLLRWLIGLGIKKINWGSGKCLKASKSRGSTAMLKKDAGEW